ncbi:S8 family serine peptidase [Nocardioides sp. YIM 152315]|uniref:S8 family serine peptidase n=1 Tax=Nocardioides sp. YIM 152315 TaxID=3031760 RepID=UPI0023DAD165|nr:S8 family serine peptidase [Nocardioides sp. YIM 152315]MDF1604202.1 S8 family serine peptidase [Nocardioides sp. YIM 152315]
MALASLLLVTSVLALAAPTTAAAAPGDPELGKIKPKLAQQLDEKGSASFWIRFADRADLSKAPTIKDRTARGQFVYDRLSKVARDSQADIKALLDGEGTSYHAFWATNAIRVQGGSQQLAEELTTHAEVEALYPTFSYKLPQPKKGENVHSPNAVEWGVANINADDVWSEFGDTGEGIVVGSIDSGTQFDHPALVNQYRGNNGDGTFDHNYNWFDAAGSCGDAPCDNDGHGTHTMGTMVGSDGGANQIGVAPGATWITANGCCPSDQALIDSGQWMLAPTDLEGENADVSKRPDIINNSWGTELPSNDPFMEDIEEDWAASGIFGSWSNGNNGPSCETSGSPGSRILNYSVGAYDVNNAIAGFSSRGAGQDGEIKPNISAPGVNVRSSVPGNGYGSASGTSMAAPHLAGTIALLWSAAPSLRGDIEGTRALLDGTAVDVDSTTCGGTADDNNVFGEGRLDALALIEAAPVGDTGTLAGTVTDAGTGDPLAGATVDVDGEFDRSTTTDADGSYSLRLPTGDYAVSASAFGYGSEGADASVTTGTTTTQDFALTAAPLVTVRGTVTDGGGHGWPLYAKVTVDGPAPDTWTDPSTGDYSLELPSGSTYSVSVDADLPGYLPATSDVEVGGGDVTHDVAVPVDASTCIAAGYRYNTDGVTEDFSGGALPDGWSVTDEAGAGQVWAFDNPGARDNLTGGEDGFAIVDSDEYGSGGEQDTSLVSPVVDMSDLTAPVVGFAQDYNNLGDSADVDVSVDGGATWETVLHQTTDVRGPRTDVLELPMAAGESAVQVRFRYYDASYAWWWEVDDVFIGNRTCDPVEGGLVVGNVRGSTGRAGVDDATVTSLDNPDDTATTKATPDDPALDDGFYQLFSSQTGRHPFEASAEQYTSQTKTVNVPRNRTATANFRLAAGQLTVDKSSISVTRRLGNGTVNRTLTLTNSGTAPLTVDLSTGGGDFEMLGGGTGTATSLRQMDNVGAAATAARSSDSAKSSGSKLGGSALGTSKETGPRLGTSGLEPGRSKTPSLPKRQNDEVTITESVSQEIASANSIACSNSATGETRDTGWLRVFPLEDFDITTDFNVTNVSFGVETVRGGDVAMNVNLYTLDGPLEYANMTLIGSTQETLSPQDLTLVTVPVEGTAPAGSSLVVEIDAPDQAGTGRAFFVGSNDQGQTAPTYLRSETCGTPEPVDVAELGFPDFHMVLNVTGETGSSVPWLTVEPTTLTLEPGDSAEVIATFDSAVEQPGTYTARISFATDSPVDTEPVAATMNITPPRSWGKVQGTVNGTDCAGAVAPIDEATVQLDWWSGDLSLFTDEDGEYAWWLDTRGNPYSVIVAKDGFKPTSRTVRILKGRTITSDYSLKEARC